LAASLKWKGRAVPDSWNNPQVYRQRAVAWRQRAASLPEGQNKEAALCIEIAKKFATLARTLEARNGTSAKMILSPTTAEMVLPPAREA
jgi:hypothetical protein